jgi:C-3',4' desaturase CrtD
MIDRLNPSRFEIAVIGAGIAGLATATRLAAAGVRTVLIERHRSVGGCAGYFRRYGFAFDVGATTLVDFEPEGVGGRWLRDIGIDGVEGERLPGYVAWLPDRTLTLHRDPKRWWDERRVLGDSPGHRAFWHQLDTLADVFWGAARRGISLPLRSAGDALRATAAVGLRGLPLARYLRWTMGGALRKHGLRDDIALVGLLSMLIEDTVHSTIDDAPLINAALGVTIRGAGLTRPTGGMYRFLASVARRYRELGGVLRLNTAVQRITRKAGEFVVDTSRGAVRARQIVCTTPASLTARIGPPEVEEALRPYLDRDRDAVGGAVAIFLGVPEEQVAHQPFTHHQLLQAYEAPLGNGNNMFISVSAPGDLASAPAGWRSVMISTHCAVEQWQGLDPAVYEREKSLIGEQLVAFARRVYPALGRNARVWEVGTPRTYERFTSRPLGAVGGIRQNVGNSNQNAIPHDVGVPGFLLAGDTTWPGLGTVACVLGSRIVSRAILAGADPVRETRFGTFDNPVLEVMR